MARRRIIPVRPANPAEILSATDEKTVTLEGPSLHLVGSLLAYARGHGPAIYGMKGERYDNPVMDALIEDTLNQVSSDASPYVQWEKAKTDESAPKTITLTGPQARLVRSLVSHAASRGRSYFDLPHHTDPNHDAERDEYEAVMNDVLSQLN